MIVFRQWHNMHVSQVPMSIVPKLDDYFAKYWPDNGHVTQSAAGQCNDTEVSRYSSDKRDMLATS
jgi:hypothetical protein